MKASRKALSKLSDFARKFDFQPTQRSVLETEFGPFQPVQEALLADLNTPEALGRLFRLVRELSEAYERGEYDGKEEVLKEVRCGFQATCDAFGFFVESKEENVKEAPAEIQELAQRRWKAKQSKDWASADQLRDELVAKGWTVKDGKDGFDLVPLVS